MQMTPSDGTGAKTAERAPTTTGASPGRDPLALVAPLRLGQRRVQHRDAIAEALAEPAERLRRERDLRHEHDRAAARARAPPRRRGCRPRSCRCRSRRTGGRCRPAVEQLVDASERTLLRVGQVLGRRLRRKRPDRSGRRVAPLAAALRVVRRDERERARRRRAVVVGEPEREIDERRRQRLRDALDRRGSNAVRQRHADLGDDAAPARVAELHLDDRALRVLRHLVRERPRHRPGGHERIDGGVAATERA